MEKIDYDKELFVADKIKTYSGVYFDAFNPNPDLIKIEDIAHALSCQPRYAGHLPKFYSVAQHSLYVMRVLPKHLKLVGLLHDASEAYLCDIPSPFKSRIPGYKAAENHLLATVLKKYGLFDTYLKHQDEIKAADIRALKIEWDVLMQGRANHDPLFAPAQSWYVHPERIEAIFLRNFNKLHGTKV
jgi:uncharacterized protein